MAPRRGAENGAVRRGVGAQLPRWVRTELVRAPVFPYQSAPYRDFVGHSQRAAGTGVFAEWRSAIGIRLFPTPVPGDMGAASGMGSGGIRGGI